MGNAFAKDAHGRPPDLLEMKNATSIPRTERNREKMQERIKCKIMLEYTRKCNKMLKNARKSQKIQCNQNKCF